MSEKLIFLSVGFGFVLPVVVLFCLLPWIIRVKTGRILDDIRRDIERRK